MKTSKFSKNELMFFQNELKISYHIIGENRSKMGAFITESVKIVTEPVISSPIL